MHARRRFLLLAPLLLALAACSSRAPLIENDEPRDYWFEFLDPGILSGPAEMHAKVRFGTGEEITIRLQANSGDTAGGAARRFAQQLNRQRPMTSNSERTGFSLRHVVRLHLYQGMRGLQFREMTAEESARQFDPTTGLRIDF